MTNRSLIIINAYLEEIKELASELADMSPRTQIEIVALCKSICLKVDKVLEAHEEDLQIIHEQLNEISTELEALSTSLNNHLGVVDDRLEALESAILLINESIATINTTLSTHTTNINNNAQAIQALQASKQDVLTAGDNITIENNVISATGGGSSAELYEHNIYIDSYAYKLYITLKIITNDITPFSKATLRNFLENYHFLGDWDNSGIYNTTGIYYYNNVARVIFGIHAYPEGDTDIYLVSSTNSLEKYVMPSVTIKDTIIHIL